MNPLTANTALWLERRLDASLDFHLPAARLYGVVVNDPLGLHDDHPQAARSSFIDCAPNVYDLLDGASAILARSFDAAAVLTVGWAAPLDEDGRFCVSRHPQRRRVRIVTVVDDHGCASVLRFEDARHQPVVNDDAREGDLVTALQLLWAGAPIVNSRTTVRACQRQL